MSPAAHWSLLYPGAQSFCTLASLATALRTAVVAGCSLSVHRARFWLRARPASRWPSGQLPFHAPASQSGRACMIAEALVSGEWLSLPSMFQRAVAATGPVVDGEFMSLRHPVSRQSSAMLSLVPSAL